MRCSCSRANWTIGLILFLLLAAYGASAAQRPAILVVGDSLSAAYKIPIAAGWVHLLAGRLARRGYDYRVVNASIPGDTTAAGLARLPASLALEHPAIVILELGANDGLQGLPLEQMRENLLRMIELSRGAGAKVLLLGVRLPPNYGPAYTGTFSELYANVAKTANVRFVPELLYGVAEHRDLMQRNGLHPTAQAEPQVLDNVWSGLLPLLGGTHRKAERRMIGVKALRRGAPIN